MKEQLHHKTQENIQYTAAQRKPATKDNNGFFLEDNRESTVMQQKQNHTQPIKTIGRIKINNHNSSKFEDSAVLQPKGDDSQKSATDVSSSNVIQKAGWNPLSTNKGKASAGIATLGLGALGFAAAGIGGAGLAVAGGIGLLGGLGYLGYKKYKNRNEHTHHNLPSSVLERRGSFAEAKLIDQVNPKGKAIPSKGLNVDDFRKHFEPLLDKKNKNISKEQLSALLPLEKSVPFPPARKQDPNTEIRAGRKWEIPNPDGGKHEIWVHTNDPKQKKGNSSNNAIVRVLDSSGRYLSNENHTVPDAIEKQKDKNSETKAAYDKAVKEGKGYWTTYHKNRTESQHIPLV